MRFLTSGITAYSFKKIPTSTPSRSPLSHLSRSGITPTSSPQIVVREARIEECWEVAKAHGSSFFLDYSFPIDLVMKVDSFLGIVWGFFVVPNGCRRTYLVAVNDSLDEDTFVTGRQDPKIQGIRRRFSLNEGYVVGTSTLDTVADYLPREGLLRQRRTGVAYLSDLAVRERFRRKGIAKKLIVEAEAQAKGWGCRAIALHCELKNTGAITLYRAQGYKSIKVPQGAKWPQPKPPKTDPDIQFNFMIKLLNTRRSSC